MTTRSEQDRLASGMLRAAAIGVFLVGCLVSLLQYWGLSAATPLELFGRPLFVGAFAALLLSGRLWARWLLLVPGAANAIWFFGTVWSATLLPARLTGAYLAAGTVSLACTLLLFVPSASRVSHVKTSGEGTDAGRKHHQAIEPVDGLDLRTSAVSEAFDASGDPD